MTTCVHLLQGTYSSHGVEMVMITIEDQRIVATKLTVRERVLDNHAFPPFLLAYSLTKLWKSLTVLPC